MAQARVAFAAAVDADPTGLAANEFGCLLVRIDCRAEALEQFHLVLKHAQRLGDSDLRAMAWNNLAVVSRDMGRFEIAASLQQRSLSAEDCADGPWNLPAKSCDLSNLANDAIHAGRLDLAEVLLRKSLCLEFEAGSLEGQASDWGSLGVVAGLKGDLDEGRTLLLRAYRRRRVYRTK